MSFGSRKGGFEFALDVRQKILDTLNWVAGAAYLDKDALEGTLPRPQNGTYTCFTLIIAWYSGCW